MEYVSIEKITGITLEGRSVIVHIWTDAPRPGPGHTDPAQTIRLSVAATHQLFRAFDRLLADPKARPTLEAMGLLPQPRSGGA
jgi:hypothetical protein